MLKFVFLIAAFAVMVLCHGPNCFKKQDPGTDENCSDAPSQRYHHDTDKLQCVAFQYKGCGGNVNNYKSPKECEDTCQVGLKSYIACPFRSGAIFNSQDRSDCPVSEPETGEGCESPDAYCRSFMTMGLCCNRTLVLGLRDDRSDTCPSGKARWMVDGAPVLAQSCDKVSCPNGYSCKSGNFFSYCCEN